jgi:HEAT repeat protein
MAGKKRPRGPELVEHVLERLSDGRWLIESEVMEAFRKHADLARPRLLAAMGDPASSPAVRLNASLYLLEIGDPAFWEGISFLLASPDADARFKAADGLSKAFLLPDEPARNAMQSSSARAGLLALLDDPDPRIRWIGAQLCGRAGVPDLDGRLRTMLRKDAEPGPRLSAALVISQEERDPEALDALIGLLDEPLLASRRHLMIHGIGRYLASPDPDQSSRAEAGLRSFYERDPKSLPLPTMEVIGFLRATRPGSLSLVDAWWRTARDPTLRGECLIALARLRGGEVRGMLFEKLGDNDIAPFAAEGLAHLHAGTGDRALIEAIAGVVPRIAASYGRRVGEAILRIGGPEAMAALRKLAERDPGSFGPQIAKAEGNDVESMVRHAVEVGLLSTVPPPSVLEEAREFWGDGAALDNLLFTILELCGILCAIDEESDEVPPPYHRLLEAFGRASRGRFDPSDVDQTDVPGECEDCCAKCEFTLAGRRFSFTPAGAGDHYDTGSAVRAINTALAETGVTERFVGVDEVWIFGEPKMVMEFARKWRLPLQRESDWRPELDRR